MTKKVENTTSQRKTNKEETHDFFYSAKYRLYAGIRERKMDQACCTHEGDDKNREKFAVKHLEELDLGVYGMIQFKSV